MALIQGWKRRNSFIEKPMLLWEMHWLRSLRIAKGLAHVDLAHTDKNTRAETNNIYNNRTNRIKLKYEAPQQHLRKTLKAHVCIYTHSNKSRCVQMKQGTNKRNWKGWGRRSIKGWLGGALVGKKTNVRLFGSKSEHLKKVFTLLHF